MEVFFFLKSLILSLIFLALALTKRAQWPFIRWLPAAMAAPTPVRALVHSSTLVTAGVWLTLRFGLRNLLNLTIFGRLGLITLLIASFSALLEQDAKKVVALSTLSQLGLMFLSLSVGNNWICTFHILIHALAKANLFIVIGVLLHSRFSQQDSRTMASSSLNNLLLLGIGLRIISLMGLLFSSGFYSKEIILIRQYFMETRITSWVILVLVSGLTLSYCLKLFISILFRNPIVLDSKRNRFSCNAPIFILRTASIIIGTICFNNLGCSLSYIFILIVYFLLFIIGFFFLGKIQIFITTIFILHSEAALKMLLLIRPVNRTIVMIETSLMETYRITSIEIRKVLNQRIHLITLIRVVMVLLFFS